MTTAKRKPGRVAHGVSGRTKIPGGRGKTPPYLSPLKDTHRARRRYGRGG